MTDYNLVIYIEHMYLSNYVYILLVDKHFTASRPYLEWSLHTSQTFINKSLLSQGMQFLNLNPTFARIGLSNALIPRK